MAYASMTRASRRQRLVAHVGLCLAVGTGADDEHREEHDAARGNCAGPPGDHLNETSSTAAIPSTAHANTRARGRRPAPPRDSAREVADSHELVGRVRGQAPRTVSPSARAACACRTSNVTNGTAGPPMR